MLSRAELIDAASKNSYEKFPSRPKPPDIVEKTGRGQYRVYLKPWWTPASDLEESQNDVHDSEIDVASVGVPEWRDVLYGAARGLDLDEDPQSWVPPCDFEDVLEAIPELRQYEHLLRVWFDELADSQPQLVARIGTTPPGAEPDQTRLTSVESGD